MDENNETLRKEEKDIGESEVKSEKKKLTPEEEMEIVRRVRAQTRSEYAGMASNKSSYNVSSIVIMFIAVLVLFMLAKYIMTSTRTGGSKVENQQTTEQSSDRAGSNMTDSGGKLNGRGLFRY